MLELTETFSRLGIALGLGLLVGLQRQRTDARLAGIRTFPLVTVLGALCALIAPHLGGWLVAVAFGGLALVIVGGNLASLRAQEDRPGVTSEVALLVMFAVGAYLMVGSTAIAIAIGGAVAVLLHLKPQMHTLAAKIGDRDFTAIMQFALISLVILPVLPNRYFGPFAVLNPFKIWLMVVLIVGISLGGYVVYKFLGARAGAWASGVLGGLISSTATTVSLARRSRQSPQTPGLAAFVIIVASAIVFVRLGILIGATAPQFIRVALVPLVVMFAVLAVLGWWNLRGRDEAAPSMPEQENPTELKPAIVFGLLYALVLLAIAAAREYFGQSGLYAVAVLSGLTDMDAITLSVTQMVNTEQISAGTGWRLIVVASMANLAFKAGTVAVLGERRLFGRVAVSFGIAAAAGAALLAFWPD
ncbi:MAG: MgtC/SapB family protein [Verrucomicrobia bacterium]|nr:MgtC/SapB family protein [Verrucomicrobiota bacterium]